MDRLQELVRLHRKETGCSEVARLLSMSRMTERKYRGLLEAAGLLKGPLEDLPELCALKEAVLRQLPMPEPSRYQVSSLEPWREELWELFDKKKLKPRAAHDRLRVKHGETYTGKYHAVKRLWRQYKRERGVLATDVAIPVETAPGEIAQVDFGYIGKLWDPQTGRLRKTWAFVMVLGYSRHMVVRLVFDQKVETWLRLHMEAFAELGGVVETVVPDNLKSAVIRAAFGVGEDRVLNRSYRELAKYMDFKIDPAPPYAPKKKGKVESAVKYIKRNILAGRAGENIEDVRRDLAIWMREVAGMRSHGTTGKQPLVEFEAVERDALRPLPSAPYEPVIWKRPTLHTDCHFLFDERLYSAPWTLVGQKLWVRATPTSVVVYNADEDRVATHKRHFGRGPRITNEDHLPEHRAPLRHRNRAYWQDKADELGDEVGAYVRDVFDSDDVLSRLRTVQSIVTYLEPYPRERAEAACRRASFYGSYTYRAIKNILTRGLDLSPLPMPVMATPAPQQAFRFARSVTELIFQPMEETHEPN